MISDETAKSALAETQSRIFAISLVHRRLYSAGEVNQVELDEYLAGLLEHLSTSLKHEGSGAVLVHDLSPLRLGTDAAVRLGIVATEWVTNAFKYAYPEGDGTIRVSLHLEPAGRGELIVEDDGVGLNVSPTPRGTGLGTRIVKAMASAIDGAVEYADQPRGTRARLSFPVLGD